MADPCAAPITCSRVLMYSTPDILYENELTIGSEEENCAGRINERRTIVSEYRPTIITNQPTLTPTTNQPTLTPITNQPTLTPTTNQPTLTPITNQPTLTPTTNQPTLTPITNQPTLTPTTNQPTLTPITNQPTLNPTTNQPTLTPITNQPTSTPTSRPGPKRKCRDNPRTRIRLKGNKKIRRCEDVNLLDKEEKSQTCQIVSVSKKCPGTFNIFHLFNYIFHFEILTQ